MKQNGTVIGTQKRKPAEIEHNGRKVYIRTDIQRITIEREGEDSYQAWQYQETVLESSEYNALSIGSWSGEWTEPVRSVERYILHSATTDDTMQALRKLREDDKTYDWQGQLDKLDAYNKAIEDTKTQPGYPQTVEYPEYPEKDSQ